MLGGRCKRSRNTGVPLDVAFNSEPKSYDSFNEFNNASWGSLAVGENSGQFDWATDRVKCMDFTDYWSAMCGVRGALVESWEMPDSETTIFHVRRGVRWHNIPPVNRRELKAHDIKYSFDRKWGIGSGFTEKTPLW